MRVGAGIQSLFAGLARCPLCDGTATRVTKGPGGGRPYLVCARAKAGGGCTYHAAPQEAVESGFLRDAGWLLGTAPSGDEAIDQELAEAEAALEAVREQIENLVDAIATRPSPALTARLHDLESDAEGMEKLRGTLQDRQATASGPFLHRKLADLSAALDAEPLDRTKINALLRQVFSRVVVDHRRGKLVFAWRQGGETELVYAWSANADAVETNAAVRS